MRSAGLPAPGPKGDDPTPSSAAIRVVIILLLTVALAGCTTPADDPAAGSLIELFEPDCTLGICPIDLAQHPDWDLPPDATAMLGFPRDSQPDVTALHRTDRGVAFVLHEQDADRWSVNHFDGTQVARVAMPPGTEGVSSLDAIAFGGMVEADGMLWARAKGEPPMLLRWDLDRGNASWTPVPGTTHILDATRTRVLFGHAAGGDFDFRLWDGRSMRSIEPSREATSGAMVGGVVLFNGPSGDNDTIEAVDLVTDSRYDVVEDLDGSVTLRANDGQVGYLLTKGERDPEAFLLDWRAGSTRPLPAGLSHIFRGDQVFIVHEVFPAQRVERYEIDTNGSAEVFFEKPVAAWHADEGGVSWLGVPRTDNAIFESPNPTDFARVLYERRG